jgi:general secretion pathway protein A
VVVIVPEDSVMKNMLLAHYGFRESPFGVTPDPRYLYASETHREALASLLYGIDSGLGFMALTATPGMGKTTLLFEVLNTIRHKAVIVFLFQPVSNPVELLRALLTEVGISSPQGGLIDLQAQLNELLIKYSEENKRFVVAIDEAQNLNDGVLEQVRMLSNFETSRYKLMQIILAGQPQLADRLASPELLQLRQRISIVARLEPLSEQETAAYIRHRLTVAGYGEDTPLFTSSAIAMIARHSEGIPRNINNLCFNALSLGCALRQTAIGPEVVREVIADLDLKPLTAGTAKDKDTRRGLAQAIAFLDKKPEWRPWLLRGAATLCVIALAFGFMYMRFLRTGHQTDQGSQAPRIQAKAAPQPAASTIEADPPAQETSEPSAAATASVSAASEAAIPEAPEAMATPARIDPSRSVRVRRGQSLREICVKTLGECGPKNYRAFLEANPGLSNPNHIVTGQKIFIPPSPSSSSSNARR